ncbi:MAG: glycosyltransferase family 4 protein [Chromatiaceae bacterium]|jgi:glycosyltransferase involved in cell wall biosynthesis|nr:glycosyltransferase family 4 protein [Chromatiaceae bacterium]
MFVTDAYGGHGGIAQYNRDVAAALAAMPEVAEVVVVPRQQRFPAADIPAKVHQVPEALGGKDRYLRAALRAARGSYDLLICGHVNLLSLATLLRLKLRVPLVLMVYGIDVWQPPAPTTRLWLRAVDDVWSISAITRDRMNAWARLPEGKYQLLPNAVHLGSYGMAQRRGELVERHGLQDKRVILTLARLSALERYKGVDEVLEAMPALLETEPKLKYLVAGDGDDRPRLEAKAAALGLGERVVFTGLIEEQEKADYYRLADVFAMPGRGEGFGFVFLEAMACGVPVVGSKVDGSREALRDGLLGELVDPTDSESVRQGIFAALEKPKRIPDGLEYFAWPAFQQRLADAVRKVVAANARSPRPR